jgi:hypothetical protein
MSDKFYLQFSHQHVSVGFQGHIITQIQNTNVISCVYVTPLQLFVMIPDDTTNHIRNISL